MKNLFDSKMSALMTIVILAVGSISGVGMAQFVIGSDGSILSNILGGCIYGACKDTKITGNVTDGILAGCVFAGCKNVEITGQGQPTPNTGTLTVIKKVVCAAAECPVGPEAFTIKVTGNNPSDDSFPGNSAGTTITLGPGDYTVSETAAVAHTATFSGNCDQNGKGTMNAGESQECTITNTVGAG